MNEPRIRVFTETDIVVAAGDRKFRGFEREQSPVHGIGIHVVPDSSEVRIIGIGKSTASFPRSSVWQRYRQGCRHATRG